MTAETQSKTDAVQNDFLKRSSTPPTATTMATTSFEKNHQAENLRLCL
jgi:hypothetical protein